MFKSLLAFTAAATCAGIFVTLVPAPGPAAGATLTNIGKDPAPTISAGNGSLLFTNARGKGRYGDCREAWPYYEQSCLHDARQNDGKSRSVRVIASSRKAASIPTAVTH
jgi:hypothetical protein